MDELSLCIDAISVIIRDIIEDTITPETREIAVHLTYLDNDMFLWIAGANPKEMAEVRKMCLERFPTKEEVLHDIYNYSTEI